MEFTSTQGEQRYAEVVKASDSLVVGLDFDGTLSPIVDDPEAAHIHDEAPDLLVDFAEGYRVSWSSSMGGVAEQAFEDNVKKWSGDHIIDPDKVPGVLFLSRPFREGARLLDLAPTILAALGVPRGPAMEGESILK